MRDYDNYWIAAAVAAGLVLGAIPLVKAEDEATPYMIPDGQTPTFVERLHWDHTYPSADGNVEVRVEVVGYGKLLMMWEAEGMSVPRGGILMGYSKLSQYAYSVPSRPDYVCQMYLANHPALDPDTYKHEMRHCNGWTHQEWTEELVTSQAGEL